MTVERPILLNGSMVNAILAGSKTETRRVVKPQPSDYAGAAELVHEVKHPAPYLDSYCNATRTEANPRSMSEHWCWWTRDDRQGPDWLRCPYGKPGDLLYVRETWVCDDYRYPEAPRNELIAALHYWQRDGNTWHDGDVKPWKPSIHMPKWAARIWLRVESVGIERLQDISGQGAVDEGIDRGHVKCGRSVESVRGEFRELWDSLYAKQGRSWEANPWVWVVKFSVASTTGRPE